MLYSIPPLSVYDVAAQQAWLEAQARKGRFLRAYDGLLSRFSKGAPQAVRYRLEALTWAESASGAVRDPDEDRLEAYRACGWSYVCRIGSQFCIWRSDDPDAPELFTDPETERQASLRLHRRLRRTSALTLAFLLFLAALTAWCQWSIPGSWLLSLARQPSDLPSILTMVLLLLFLLARLVWENHMLRRLLRTLRAGVPVPRSGPFRAKAVLNGVFLALLLLLMVQGVLLKFRPVQEDPVSLAETDLPPGYVSLTALEPEAVTQGQITRGPGILSAAYWHTRETDENGGVLSMEYFRLRAPALGPGIEERLRREFTQAQKLVLRRGGEVLSVSYLGPADLSAYGDRFQLPPS